MSESGNATATTTDTEPVWQSAENTLQEVRAGNPNHNLALSFGLKHRIDLFEDPKQRNIEDITIFRINGADGVENNAVSERR